MKSPLARDYLEGLGSEELVNPDEGWMVFKNRRSNSKGTEKRKRRMRKLMNSLEKLKRRIRSEKG